MRLSILRLFVLLLELKGFTNCLTNSDSDVVRTSLIVSEIENQDLRWRKDKNLKLLLYNGTYPGPTLRVTKGQKLVVTVYNELSNYSTTIHWHGMLLNRMPWYDGVPGISQCAIKRGETFTYEIDTSLQAGTFWYHSHFDGQYADGLVGPLVIEDPQFPHHYDDEFVLMVSDWYETNDTDILLGIMHSRRSKLREPDPENVLINGSQNNTNFNVLSNKKILLRFICSSAIGAFNIFFENGNDFEIVEVDGIYTNKKTVSSFELAPAQRVSILVTISESTSLVSSLILPYNQFTMSAFAHFHIKDVIMNDESRNNTRIQEYLTLHNFDKSVTPLIPENAPEPVNYVVELNISMAYDKEFIMRGYLNKHFLLQTPNANPILPNILSNFNESDYETLNPFVFRNSSGSVEIILNNLQNEDHPFHLHGNLLYVLGSGRGLYNGGGQINTDNPIRRDTVIVPKLGWLLLRFWPTNVGAWLCIIF
jgi:iron transport multicopper oxidase